MIEKWLPIDDLPYEVSDMGRVRRSVDSKTSKSGTFLKPWPNDKGYMRVSLRNKNRYVHTYVHILVLAAFVGTCPPGKETNHKDGVKANCRLDNLEYLTKGENNQHAWDTGLTPRIRIREEFCSRGHLKISSYTQQNADGRHVVYLRCKECRRDRANEKRHTP